MGPLSANFARLTARVFMDVGDAERYSSTLLWAPANMAFHIMESGEMVFGIVKAIVTEHRAQVGYVVHEPFRGRGFATRAVEVMVKRLEADPTSTAIAPGLSMQPYCAVSPCTGRTLNSRLGARDTSSHHASSPHTSCDLGSVVEVHAPDGLEVDFVMAPARHTCLLACIIPTCAWSETAV